jgi:hypothetical protein
MPKGHYQRTPRSIEKMHASLRRRLERMSEPVPFSGCVIFTGALDRQGYGKIGLKKGVHLQAHRAAYRIYKGSIPDGLIVMHKCDVRCCVNPDHLVTGTHKDNTRDMFSKGREKLRWGSSNRYRVLTPDIVREIRQSADGLKTLADKFGVSVCAVRSARLYQTWKHVA